MIHATYTGTEDYWLTKLYYSYGNYTKFIRPGFKIIGAGSGSNNVIAAYNEATHRVVFVMMNDTDSPVDYTYNLSKFASVGTTAAAYRTSSTENLAQLSNISITDKSFAATAPAKSITTYVVDNAYPSGNRILNDSDTGTGDCKFNFSGTWGYTYDDTDYYWDNHFSGTTNDYYTVSFTGTKVKVTGPKDINYGYAAFSIDNGAETNVDCYSLQRTGGQTIYESPDLPRGHHTLKVRVTGSKNTLATGYTVSADRVDVEDIPGVSYEAESGTLSGGAGIYSASFASSGYKVSNLGGSSNGTCVINNIYVPTAGSYKMTVNYISSDNRNFYVTVNNGSSTQLSCPGSGNWTTLSATTMTVSLNAGYNSIKFDNSTGSYAPDLDRVVIDSDGIAYEAESGALSGGAGSTAVNFASNAHKVSNLGGSSNGTCIINNVYVPVAGNYTMVVYYISSNARNLYVTVNNGSAAQLSCPGSGSWSIISSKTMTVSLNAGNNSIKFDNSSGSYAPDLDRIVID
jgi:O-Glycosyl hydrolase